MSPAPRDDLETLLKDLAYAHDFPVFAVSAALPQASAIAPRVEALARRMAAGDWISASESQLLFFGLFILAAAKERSIWPAWLDLLNLPAEDFEPLFGFPGTVPIAQITLALVEDDSVRIAAAIRDPDISHIARSGLMRALTRLMCEGRYERASFVALVDRLALGDDDMRLDAEDAIVMGGVAERADLLEKLWRSEELRERTDEDKAGLRELLKVRAASPQTLDRLDQSWIRPPHGALDALNWFKNRDILEDDEPNPPEAQPLSWRERDRLAELLEATSANGEPMAFEEFDGYSHALVLGPNPDDLADDMRLAWGDEGAVGADAERVNEAAALILRHWNAMAQRRLKDLWPRPFIERQEGFLPGQLWSLGFSAGRDVHADAWSRLFEEERYDLAVPLRDFESLDDPDLDPDERKAVLREMPVQLSLIDEYWRTAPVRTQKVGRNEPCPCGSGKKWKKCCGAADIGDL